MILKTWNSFNSRVMVVQHEVGATFFYMYDDLQDMQIFAALRFRVAGPDTSEKTFHLETRRRPRSTVFARTESIQIIMQMIKPPQIYSRYQIKIYYIYPQ